MNKKRVLIFSGIAIFALLGITITQMFWVKDALELRKEQFTQRVKVALKSVSTQILDAQIDSAAKYLLTPCDTDFFNNKPMAEIIDANATPPMINGWDEVSNYNHNPPDPIMAVSFDFFDGTVICFL